MYSTNLPQSSMYMQRNQKLPFLREENVGGLERQARSPALLPLTRVADYSAIGQGGNPLERP